MMLNYTGKWALSDFFAANGQKTGKGWAGGTIFRLPIPAGLTMTPQSYTPHSV
jgi:hypothetical protein